MIKTENFKIREIVDIVTNSLWPDLTDEIRLENQDVCFKITLLKYCPFPNGNKLCITEYIDKESLDKGFELAVPAMAKSIIDRWKRSLEEHNNDFFNRS